MPQKRQLVLALAAVLAGTVSFASVKDMPRYGVFVYSNLCSEDESGDIDGYRIVLVRLGLSDDVIFYYGNGPIQGASRVVLDRDALQQGKLVFEADTDDGKKSFRGRITDDAYLVETVDGKTERIARLRDLSDKIPECRLR